MTAYTNVTADDWVMADPVEPPRDAGECASCRRAVQRCCHVAGCQLWLDSEDGAFCSDGALHDPLVRHVRGTGCCCYPEPCAGHVVDERGDPPASPRHPWAIACNEPSFHGNGV